MVYCLCSFIVRFERLQCQLIWLCVFSGLFSTLLLQQHSSSISLSVFRTVGAQIPGTGRLRKYELLNAYEMLFLNMSKNLRKMCRLWQMEWPEETKFTTGNLKNHIHKKFKCRAHIVYIWQCFISLVKIWNTKAKNAVRFLKCNLIRRSVTFVQTPPSL